MRKVDIWNKNKLWISPLAALLLWVVSFLCFVFGLSFKNPIGINVGPWDLFVWVSIILSLCNTFIQIIGNDMKFTDDDRIFQAIWLASYVLGISSNVNTLLQVLNMNNAVLEWGVALSLGSIIEIAPEKMIVMWLRSLDKVVKNNAPIKKSHGNMQFQPKFHKGKSEDFHSKDGNYVVHKNEKPKHKPIFDPEKIMDMFE